MFWKAGLKITPVYKERRGSPLSLTPAQAGWAPGRAGGLGPEWGRFPVPGPWGWERQPSSESRGRLASKTYAESGHCGCSCFKSFFSGKVFSLPAPSGERGLSWDCGCACTQAQGLAARVRILPLPPPAGAQSPHL